MLTLACSFCALIVGYVTGHVAAEIRSEARAAQAYRDGERAAWETISAVERNADAARSLTDTM